MREERERERDIICYFDTNKWPFGMRLLCQWIKMERIGQSKVKWETDQFPEFSTSLLLHELLITTSYNHNRNQKCYLQKIKKPNPKESHCYSSKSPPKSSFWDKNHWAIPTAQFLILLLSLKWVEYNFICHNYSSIIFWAKFKIFYNKQKVNFK